MLPVWQKSVSAYPIGRWCANKARAYQTQWRLVPNQEGQLPLKLQKREQTVVQVLAQGLLRLLPPPPRALRPRRRRANTIDENEEEREEGKEEAQRARHLERNQAHEAATRAAKRQRMEDELRARVKEAERAAAAKGHPDLEEEEAQWENRMAELRQREDAVLQGQVWTPSSNNLGGAGI